MGVFRVDCVQTAYSNSILYGYLYIIQAGVLTDSFLELVLDSQNGLYGTSIKVKSD
jgi:hypothetical protein